MAAADPSAAANNPALPPGAPSYPEQTSQKQQQIHAPQPQTRKQHQIAQPAPGASIPAQPMTPNARNHLPRSPASPSPAMPPPQQPQSAASPPTKRDLKSWWKGFKLQSRNHDIQGNYKTFFHSFSLYLLLLFLFLLCRDFILLVGDLLRGLEHASIWPTDYIARPSIRMRRNCAPA